MQVVSTQSSGDAAIGILGGLEDRHCALCGAGAPKNVKYAASFRAEDLNARIFSARRMPDRRHFRLVECGNCGIIFSDPACDPSNLAALYQQSSVSYGSQERQIHDSYAPILDRALARTPNRSLFLEIGGGTGFMLRYGAEKGFREQIEIEPSADAERKFVPPGPGGRFIRGVFERGMIPEGSVSLACFFQMLDHVPDPLRFLHAVFEALEPGGVAVCVTHNTRALSARILGERSPIYDIEHTYLFNPSNMSLLFERAGFSGLEAFPIANRYSARHWLNLAPLPRLAKGSLLSGLEILGLADLPLRLRAGNFAVIGGKKG